MQKTNVSVASLQSFTDGASIMMHCYSNVKKTTNDETKYGGIAKTK